MEKEILEKPSAKGKAQSLAMMAGRLLKGTILIYMVGVAAFALLLLIMALM